MSAYETLQGHVGEELGVSEWMTIDQDRINAFADATDDHQWIHIDADRAAAGPFGTTIAHGFLTLSMVVALTQGIEMPVSGAQMGLNYGLDRVRFITPVPAGSRIRARSKLVEVKDLGGGDAVQVKSEVTIELEGVEKPACVAETLARIYF